MYVLDIIINKCQQCLLSPIPVRLEEMKKNRKDRSEAASEAKAAPAAAPPPPDTKVDVDSLVNSLLAADIAEPAKPIAAPIMEVHKVISREDAAREKAKVLGTNKSLMGINIFPVQKEFYDKGCQKDDESQQEQAFGDDGTPVSTPAKLAATPSAKSAAGRGRARSLSCEAQSPCPEAAAAEEVVVKKVFTAEEQQQLADSAPFQSFLQSSATIVERVLAQTEDSFDYLRDYTDDADSMINSTENRALHAVRHFTDPCLASRPVMDIQACPHYPELFLAAYGSVGQILDDKNSWGTFSHAPPQGNSSGGSSPVDAAGVACVWSLSLPTRPEFIFTATSPVLSAIFHPTDQHLVIGGCYSGQLLLWDMRAKSLPVQRSNLAGRGHKHPVYCMHGVDGSTSSNELITSSTDGMVCHWDLTRLTEPTVTNNVSFTSRADGSLGNGVLFDTSAPSLKSACVTSMAFGTTDGSRDIYLGTDSGKLLKTALPIRAKDASSAQVCDVS
jgi:dynein intermediate chain